MSKESSLIEVWGDTVDRGELGKAIVIGGAIALIAFVAARAVLTRIVPDPALAASYAMLVGLAGCLIGGVVCAKLYRPKREVIENSADDGWREATMAELDKDPLGMGRLADLPPNVVAELKEIGLYETFANHEHAGKSASAGTPADASASPAARGTRA